jgi:lipopolysaccharide export system protein LptA
MRRTPPERRGRPERPPVALLAFALVVVGPLVSPAASEPAKSEPAKSDGIFDAGGFGGNRKEPIDITSDTLEYDYKANVVVYRGDVIAIQGDMKLRSDTLTVTLVRDGNGTPGADPEPAKAAAGQTQPSGQTVPPSGGQKVQEIIAVGSVRIDNGTRWATGGRAVFEQSSRTLVLTENPMLHDGPNEVAGDRVVVYLDENRSVVEGGRKRVKAVVYPGKDGGLAPTESAKAGTPTAPAKPTAGADVAATP